MGGGDPLTWEGAPMGMTRATLMMVHAPRKPVKIMGTSSIRGLMCANGGLYLGGGEAWPFTMDLEPRGILGINFFYEILTKNVQYLFKQTQIIKTCQKKLNY